MVLREPHKWVAPALLILAVLFGGGGSRYPLQNFVIQAVGIGALTIGYKSSLRGFCDQPFGLRILVCFSLALPLLYLIPLPPIVWQGIPGGNIAAEARAIVGLDKAWFPLSLDRARTVLAFASLIPPLAIIVFARSSVGVQSLVRTILALACANVLLGTIQMAAAANVPYTYPVLESGRLYGFFANHNTSGLFLVIALCLTPAVEINSVRDARFNLRVDIVVKIILSVLMILGVILTQSRSSISIMFFVVTLWSARAVWDYWSASAALRRVGMIACLGAIVGTLFLTARSDRVGSALGRFANLDDQRYAIWGDVIVAIATFFPFGAGIGSFDEVFQNFESLDTLVPFRVRRAHNEYLELGLEAGAGGLLLLTAWIVWFLATWWGARRAPVSKLSHAAGIALVSIAAQSFVDYPLRNEAMLCVFATLIVVFLSRPTGKNGVP